MATHVKIVNASVRQVQIQMYMYPNVLALPTIATQDLVVVVEQQGIHHVERKMLILTKSPQIAAEVGSAIVGMQTNALEPQIDVHLASVSVAPKTHAQFIVILVLLVVILVLVNVAQVLLNVLAIQILVLKRVVYIVVNVATPMHALMDKAVFPEFVSARRIRIVLEHQTRARAVVANVVLQILALGRLTHVMGVAVNVGIKTNAL